MEQGHRVLTRFLLLIRNFIQVEAVRARSAAECDKCLRTVVKSIDECTLVTSSGILVQKIIYFYSLYTVQRQSFLFLFYLVRESF